MKEKKLHQRGLEKAAQVEEMSAEGRQEPAAVDVAALHNLSAVLRARGDEVQAALVDKAAVALLAQATQTSTEQQHTGQLEQLAREQGNSDAASCNTEVEIESPGTEMEVRDGLDDPQGSGTRAADALEGQLGGSLAKGSIGPHSAGGAQQPLLQRLFLGERSEEGNFPPGGIFPTPVLEVPGSQNVQFTGRYAAEILTTDQRWEKLGKNEPHNANAQPFKGGSEPASNSSTVTPTPVGFSRSLSRRQEWLGMVQTPGGAPPMEERSVLESLVQWGLEYWQAEGAVLLLQRVALPEGDHDIQGSVYHSVILDNVVQLVVRNSSHADRQILLKLAELLPGELKVEVRNSTDAEIASYAAVEMGVQNLPEQLRPFFTAGGARDILLEI